MKLATVSIVVIFLFLFVPLIGQILICKYLKGRAGLILPVLAFIVSIINVINVDASGGDWWKIALTAFLSTNISTIIYYLVYRYYDNKEKQKDELDKMEIMDM